jgi:integrase
MKQLDNQITFEMNTLLKTSKPGKHIKPLVFKAYPVDKFLCVVTCLKQYLLKTSVVRDGNNELWLSFNKPHNPVSKDTIARWIKTVMGKAGIYTSCYGGHSTRSASTSAASSTKLPIDIIMKAAGWSSETTFQRFYNKPIEHSANFGEHLLLSYQDVNK